MFVNIGFWIIVGEKLMRLGFIEVGERGSLVGLVVEDGFIWVCIKMVRFFLFIFY